MVTERTIVGVIEVRELGQMFVRKDTIIERDGVEIARTYHRVALEPGQDVTTQDKRVADVAGVLWTPEVIDAYNKKKAESVDILAGAKSATVPNTSPKA